MAKLEWHLFLDTVLIQPTRWLYEKSVFGMFAWIIDDMFFSVNGNDCRLYTSN